MLHHVFNSRGEQVVASPALGALPSGVRERLRVLVVDDHPLFRFGVCTLLAAEPGIDVVGEAASGANAGTAAAALHPDVVVMDLHLPDLSGIQATRHIVAECPDIGVLMLTMA